MYAKDLVNEKGSSLVGKYVFTECIGGWPGGLAMVVTIMHDVEAPEIVMMVKQGKIEMGIFEDELILLVPDDFRLPDGIV